MEEDLSVGSGCESKIRGKTIASTALTGFCAKDCQWLCHISYSLKSIELSFSPEKCVCYLFKIFFYLGVISLLRQKHLNPFDRFFMWCKASIQLHNHMVNKRLKYISTVIYFAALGMSSNRSCNHYVAWTLPCCACSKSIENSISIRIFCQVILIVFAWLQVLVKSTLTFCIALFRFAV